MELQRDPLFSQNRDRQLATNFADLLNSILELNHIPSTARNNYRAQRFTPESLAYGFSPEYDKKQILQYLAKSMTMDSNVLSDAELELSSILDKLNFPRIIPLNSKLLSNLTNASGLPHYHLKNLVKREKYINLKKRAVYENLKHKNKLLKQQFLKLESQLASIDQPSQIQLVAPGIPAFDNSSFQSFYSAAFDHNHAIRNATNSLNDLVIHYSTFGNEAKHEALALSLKSGSSISSHLSSLLKNTAHFYNSQTNDFDIIDSKTLGNIPFPCTKISDFVHNGVSELNRVQAAVASLLAKKENAINKIKVLESLIFNINQINLNYDFESSISTSFGYSSLLSLADIKNTSTSEKDYTRESLAIVNWPQLQSTFADLINETNSIKSKYITEYCLETVSKVYNSSVNLLKNFGFDKTSQVLNLINLIRQSVSHYSTIADKFQDFAEFSTGLTKQNTVSNTFSSSNKLLMHTDWHLLDLSSILTEYLNFSHAQKGSTKPKNMLNPVFSPFSLLLSQLNEANNMLAKNKTRFHTQLLSHRSSEIIRISLEIENFALALRSSVLNLGSCDPTISFIPLRLSDMIYALADNIKTARVKYKSAENAVTAKQSSHYKILGALFTKFYKTPLEFEFDSNDLSIKVVKSETDNELVTWIRHLSSEY